MKKKIILLLILASLTYSCEEKGTEWSTIQISGKINTQGVDEVKFYPFENLTDDYTLMQTSKVINNNFKFSYTLNKDKMALLILNKKRYYIYVEPQKNIELEINSDYSITFKNEKEKNNLVYSEYLSKHSANLNFKLPVKKFTNQIDSLERKKITFIKNNKNRISNNFYNFLENYTIYNSAKEKIYYARRYNPELIKKENNYFDFLKKIEIQDESLINNYGYLNFVDNYINYLYLDKIWNKKVEYKNDYIEKYYLAKTHLKGNVLEQILTENLVLGISHKIEKEKFNSILNEFLSGENSGNLKNLIKNRISKFENSKLSVGKTLPNFELIDNNDQKLLLSNFKKKYLIIDFWASWCGPCRASIPKMIEISKKHKENSNFAFISIDSNKENWKKAKNQLKIPIPNFIIDKEVQKIFGFDKAVSIPYYLVLDNNGKVILRNPSVNEIETFLNEN
ncbi:hypothetical protein GCM10011416_24070 [Polaribacter pacificus]|uniref:Thioredoxin domain-containing protein n=1 Tax=Polaribacter pacificus TaxID=1775173 RepID=A0A917I1R5_9FLAO|nr:TlpA disulfide reductase family protein [Polaribacter pacificus]GGH04144.1 hypothetical protein GCM10011416_24070 [Polaribacter pacificus]